MNHREKFVFRVLYRVKASFDSVHTYLCGMMQKTSTPSNAYFLTFINDYSKKNISLFSKKRLKPFTVFKRFKFMVCNVYFS